ncbi:Golgi transport complex subunit 6 [Lambiella insularis]|nr:Golgi transport complex subunit 6 [Lambiella insularis]
MNASDFEIADLVAEYGEDPLSGYAPQRSNALSNKLSSILSTSFADAEIRDALRTLDERGIQNSPGTRRHLRLAAQKEVFERNGDVIEDFGRVAEQLRRIGSTIASLKRCCEGMQQHVAATHRDTGPTLEEANTLFSQSQENNTKQQLLDAFKSHFIMSGDDLEALNSTVTPVDDKFFGDLARLKQIHRDCQVLLGSENQQLGLELMDKSSRDLNAAFQKLYRWVQKEFQAVNLENPQINASIRRSLRVLAERPTLFQSCLDFFAESRDRNLSDSFYTALTGTSNNQDEDPITKPIDYHAHEPLRFVSDMLAWTHSATVSEREALEVLFVSEGDEIVKGIRAGIESEPWLQETTELFDGKKSLEQLVNRDLTGVARALRQRVEQVIQTDEDPVLVYKIANLIDFYRATFKRLLGSESTILDTLTTLQQSALRQYRTIMQDRATFVATQKLNVSPDLSPPEFLLEALDQLGELMKSYDSSLAPAESREAEFSSILTDSLDPFLKICKNMASKIAEPALSIFTINCLLAAKSSLTSYDFTAERLAEMDNTIDEHATNLVDYQHAFFLHTSGLHPLLAVLAPLSDSVNDLKAISTLAPFQKQSLADASQILDDFLPSALMDAMENLRLLKATRLVQELTSEAASLFCEDFQFVEGRLTAADVVYANEDQEGEAAAPDSEKRLSLRTLYPRTSGEIRVLLS